MQCSAAYRLYIKLSASHGLLAITCSHEKLNISIVSFAAEPIISPDHHGVHVYIYVTGPEKTGLTYV